MRSFLAPPLTMASPFVGVPVDLGALIVQASLRRQRVFRDRTDPLALSDDILYERYRFSSEGIRYLIFLVGPYVVNATQRSRALTSLVYMDTSDPHRFLCGIENDHMYASFGIQLSVRHRILCRIEEVV